MCKITVSLRAVYAASKADDRIPGPNQRFRLSVAVGRLEGFGSAVRICFTLALAKKLI
jgi:hypothetical protein